MTGRSKFSGKYLAGIMIPVLLSTSASDTTSKSMLSFALVTKNAFFLVINLKSLLKSTSSSSDSYIPSIHSEHSLVGTHGGGIVVIQVQA